MNDQNEPTVPGEGESAVPEGDTRPVWQRVLSIVVTVAVLVAVFGFILPQLADYGAIADDIADIPVRWWIALTAAAAVFLCAYPIVLTTVLRTLRFREAFANHMTGTAVTNSLPSGGAIAVGLNYAMYLSWGFTPGSVSAGLLAGGVWDWFGRLLVPILAIGAVAITSDAELWMWIVGIAGIAWVTFSVWLIAVLLRSERLAGRVADLADRASTAVAGWLRRDPPQTREAVLRFRTELRTVVTAHALPISAATLLNHAAMTGLYVLSIYAVGVTTDQISIPWVVLSFALGRFLVMIPVSPGGLGLVDLGWIGLLTLGWETTNPGVPVNTDLIAAGVLLFRALSLLPPIPVGMGSWIFWRSNTSWRQDWRTARRGSIG